MDSKGKDKNDRGGGGGKNGTKVKEGDEANDETNKRAGKWPYKRKCALKKV